LAQSYEAAKLAGAASESQDLCSCVVLVA